MKKNDAIGILTKAGISYDKSATVGDLVALAKGAEKSAELAALAESEDTPEETPSGDAEILTAMVRDKMTAGLSQEMAIEVALAQLAHDAKSETGAE